MVIQIDVHPAGETRSTRHTHPTLSPCMVIDHTYLTWLTHRNISRNHQQSWAGPLLPRKKGSWHNPQHDGWSIHRSIPSFSLKPTNEAVGAKPTFCWWPTTRLIGHISPACNQYIQYLLAGVNPSVFNRHGRGLQPWRCQLDTSHSLTFSIDDPLLST
jgi:hypothetical protein